MKALFRKQIALYLCLFTFLLSCKQTDMWNKIEEITSGSGGYPVITIAAASINIDGNMTDWTSVPVLIQSAAGSSSIPGTDIEYVKAAVNSSSQRMFVLMKMANGSLNSGYVYGIFFEGNGFRKQVYCRDSWIVYGQDDITSQSIPASGNVSVNSDYIEFSFDLSGFSLPQYFNITAVVYDSGGGGDADSEALENPVTIPPAGAVYSVTYISNGADSGSAPLDSVLYASGQNAITLGNIDLALTGHTFFCWNTQADGLGIDYIPGSPIMINSDFILYAKWGLNPPSSGMVAEYLFTGTANDTSGNGFDGTVNGATITQDRFGNSNSAYLFDGNDYIQLVASNVMIPVTTSSYTASFWFKMNSYTATAAIISSCNGTPGDSTFFISSYLDNNNATLIKLYNDIRESNVTYTTNSSERMDDGSWHHAVIITDKSSLYSRMYVDSILVKETPITNLAFIDNGAIRIGASYYNSVVSNYFTGLIDDIRLYNRVLSLSEISSLYHENNWKDKVSTPAFDKNGGFYQGPQNIYISCATSGADIYYTQDGSEPTQSSQFYSGAVSIPSGSTVVLKARAYKSGYIDSAVATQIFNTITDYVIQPGLTDGNDTFVCSSNNIVYNDSVYNYILRTGGWGDEYRTYIKFDISSAPVNPASVKLYLYAYNNTATLTSMYIDKVTSSWDESTLRWSNQPTFTNISTIPEPPRGAWYVVDITATYNAWKASPSTNFGLALRPLNTSNTWTAFYSSEFLDDPSLRPALIITP